MTNLTHPYISATALARTYLYMCGWREYGASPELTEEVEDIEALDVTNVAEGLQQGRLFASSGGACNISPGTKRFGEFTRHQYNDKVAL